MSALLVVVHACFLWPLERVVCVLGAATGNRLVGQVVKASVPKVEGPEFESRLRRDFSGSSHTSHLKNWHSSGHPGRHLAF